MRPRLADQETRKKDGALLWQKWNIHSIFAPLFSRTQLPVVNKIAERLNKFVFPLLCMYIIYVWELLHTKRNWEEPLLFFPES